MHLHYGRIPESPDFHPEAEGWTALSEPSVGLFVWIASGVGMLLGIAAAAAWMATTQSATVLSISGGSGLAGVLVALAKVLGGLLLLIVVHELIHAAVFPGGWLGRRTAIGVWPLMGLFYAHYDGPQSRNRFLLVLLMPFLILTVGLWLVQLIFQTSWGGPLAAWSIVNALFAGGDLAGTLLVAWQVPAQAEVRNQSWKTWWRQAGEK